MPKIVVHELAELLSGLASPVEWTPGSEAIADDLFLCALGFEPRCLTVARARREGQHRSGRVAYLKYSTNLADNEANLSELDACLRAVSKSVEPLETDVADFPGRLRALLELVKTESATRPSVSLDISVMANRLLLRCVKILLDYDVSLRILYSEAAIYHPTKDEYEREPAKWKTDDVLGLERGVSDVMPSIDHPGDTLDPIPDVVLLFPSFKAERSKAIISFVDPSLLNNPGQKVVWLVGAPHHDTDRWRIDAMKTLNEIAVTAKQYEVSTFDYKDTLRVLGELHKELAGAYRLTLSPLGSKMQALGTALFCHMHSDVRVIFATPKEYNAAQYSKGCKAIWKIDFGSLVDVREKLRTVGRLEVVD